MASLKTEFLSSANASVAGLGSPCFVPIINQDSHFSTTSYSSSAELSDFQVTSSDANFFCFRDINDNVQSSLIMNSIHSEESRMISHANESKSMGAFTSSLVNSRYNNFDTFNNNLNSLNRDLFISMESNVTSSGEDAPRVPVNGQVVDQVKSTPTNQAAQVGSASSNSDLSARKGSLTVATTTVPYMKCRDLMLGSEPWKDDSLSLSSSFSSSMSSLPSIPSPPSPASPPSFRPQSLPQAADLVASDSDLLSSSLPESAFHTTYCTNSCGGSPRKRVKDKEGFIRRAACVCVNAEETEVMLVSSKSSSEVWLVPGGGLEEGEDAAEAALREAYEEAGIRGTILAYLGLFESRPEMNTSGKKHRTAVYVIKVTKEEDDFPEFKTHGRQRKWMSVDDALLHLSCNRPRQSVYLQLLRATRLKGGTNASTDDTSCSKTGSGAPESTDAALDQYRRSCPIQVLEREDSEGSVVADESLAEYQEENKDEETLLYPDLVDCDGADVARALESRCLLEEVPHETTLTESDASDHTELMTSSKFSAVSSSNESLVTPSKKNSPSFLEESSDLESCVLKSTENSSGADMLANENDEAEKILASEDITCDELSEAARRTCSAERLCSEMSFSVNDVQQIYY